MNSQTFKCTVALPLLFGFVGLVAAADHEEQCNVGILKGRYVHSASGFTRPPTSAPGTPWVPKAVLQVFIFNGDGTLTNPGVNLANPFNDLGNIVHLPATGAASDGVYSVNDDCSGALQFFTSPVTYSFFVDAFDGDRLWMIQTNPPNNVFPGLATRVSTATPGCASAGSEAGQIVSPRCGK